MRYQVTWQETEISGVGQDIIEGTLGWGMEGGFNAQEDYLVENGY